MNETTFIRSIHAKLPKEVYAWKINANFVAGVADAWYCGGGGSLWVEYKFLPIPARGTSTIRPPPNDNQRDWLVDRAAQNQQTALIVGVDTPKKEVVIFVDDIPRGYAGITKAEFMERAVTRDDVVAFILQRVTFDHAIN